MTEYITTHPLFGLLITLLFYQLGLFLYQRSGKNAFFQPIVIGIVAVTGCLLVLNIPYAIYFKSAKPLHYLLGPAIVALAIPLYLNIRRIRNVFIPILITIVSMCLINIAVVVAIAWVLGADEDLLLSLAPKSITTPMAISVAEKIGAHPSLSAAFVVFTGILGASAGPLLLTLFGIKDPAVKGLALGISAHAIGTSKALELGEECGAFSAIGMGLMGLATAIMLPLIVTLFF